MAIKNLQKIKDRRKKEKEEMMNNSSEAEIGVNEKVEVEESVEMKTKDKGSEVVDSEDPEQGDAPMGIGSEGSVSTGENLADDKAQDKDNEEETASQNITTSKEATRKNNMSMVYRLAKSRGQTRKYYKERVFSIVNSGKCRRFLIPERMIAEIGNPDLVQVGITDKGILISRILSANKNIDGYFQIRRQGRMYVLYSGKLVDEITDEFALDFSNGSLKFDDVEYCRVNRKKAAHIKLI